MAAKLIGSSMVISTIICFHIICSDTQLGWQLLPPIYYLPPPLLLQSNNIHTIDKPRPALFLRCLLYNYLWRHNYIHLLIFYSSSIYWPFLWISNVVCHHYALVPLQILNNQSSSIPKILTSINETRHLSIIYTTVPWISGCLWRG